jgi:GNAT superfamily N-acetyltransferase
VTRAANPVVVGAAQDAAALRELALRSKGYWGNDAALLEVCRDELTLSADRAAAARVVRGPTVRVRGFHLSVPDGAGDASRGELLMLFVDPPAIRSGVGAALLDDELRYAARLGWSTLRVESDPGAEGFYVTHGARRVGTVPSGSVPGRVLPLLELPVPPA